MTARTDKATVDTSGDPVAVAQADVDRIRDDLAGTVDALVAKTDVGARAKEAGSRLSGQVGDAAGRIKDASAALAGDGQERVHTAGEQARGHVAAARANLRAHAMTSRRRSPEVVAALGVVAAMLVTGLVIVLRRRH